MPPHVFAAETRRTSGPARRPMSEIRSARVRNERPPSPARSNGRQVRRGSAGSARQVRASRRSQLEARRPTGRRSDRLTCAGPRAPRHGEPLVLTLVETVRMRRSQAALTVRERTPSARGGGGRRGGRPTSHRDATTKPAVRASRVCNAMAKDAYESDGSRPGAGSSASHATLSRRASLRRRSSPP